ncbi:MAG: type I polyketide synthase, partial [Planctomycetales bacterium]
MHFNRPNSYIPWDDLPVVVPTQRQVWKPRRGRRIGGVSSFGFSGTNAHIILEEAPEPPAARPEQDRPRHLLVLSAKSESALKDLTGRYLEHLTENPQTIPSACYTAAVGRSHFTHRLAVAADDAMHMQQSLTAACEGRRAAGLVQGRADGQQPPKVAFLFTGQGSQYVGMGQELYKTQPTFRRVMNTCDEILRDQIKTSLLKVIYPEDGMESALDETAFTQPALFAIEYALYELWKSWGLEPQLVVGHSVGEYIAACAAGVFNLEDGLKLIAARGRLMQALPSAGQMVAIMANEPRVAHAIQRSGRSDVSIAAVNDPNQTVVSGADEGVDAVVSALQADGVQAKRLTVSHAFHSKLMDPMLDEFAKVCSEVRFAEPVIPIVSNVYGRVVSTEIAAADYWLTHIRETVRFADGVGQLEEQGVNVFLEIGPQPVLTASGRRCTSGNGYVWVPSLRENRGDWLQMLQSLADLYVRGVYIDWDGFDRDYLRRKLSLPHNVFQRKRYWLDSVDLPEKTSTDLGTTSITRPSALSDTLEEAFYEIRWQPKSRLDQKLTTGPSDFIPSPQEIVQRVQPEVQRLNEQFALPRYQDFDKELDRLSAAYARRALSELGWSPQPGETFSEADLADALHVVPAHRRLFGRLLEIHDEEGILRRAGNDWQVAEVIPPQPDPELMWSMATTRFTECGAELTLLGQCGRELAGVLNGTIDPLQLLFPGGSSALVERLYQESPFARTLNSLV